MSNIIHVDFKKKEKVEDYITYQWVDAITGQQYVFDSRKDDNIVHTFIPIYGQATNGQLFRKELTFKIDELKIIVKELTETLEQIEEE
jgi:hypothetical protein